MLIVSPLSEKIPEMVIPWVKKSTSYVSRTLDSPEVVTNTCRSWKKKKKRRRGGGGGYTVFTQTTSYVHVYTRTYECMYPDDKYCEKRCSPATRETNTSREVGAGCLG